MRYLITHAFMLLSLCACCMTALALSAQNNRRGGDAPEIAYTVSMARPHTHLLDVEMRLTYARSPGAVELVLPVWTPGSYLVREFARHVQDFAATGAGGRQLVWTKTNKNTWRVETGGARELRITYSVYANELTVRTNELNDRHAFWNNAALLFYPEGHLNAPSTVRVVPHNGWKVATGLPEVGGTPNTFRAANFDILYDSPFLAANFLTLNFEVGGVPHRFIIDGEGNYDPERIRRDTQKIVEATRDIMGDLPYRNYTFMLMLRQGAGGGLEHFNSTALIRGPFSFRPESAYIDFMSLVAHEFFHVWNVKLIRPDVLGPFNYTGENYTRLLWVAEGFTSYYEDLLLRRAGLITDREFLDRVTRTIQKIQETPGRLEMSVEEASFDAWIKHYRPDENSINSQVSYYDKGGLLAFLLDLRLRRVTNGARSLDDVMRRLNDEFARKGRNYTPEDFQRAVEAVAGTSLEDFFSRYVRGREELDYDAELAAAGLRLDKGGNPVRQNGGRSYLGATLAQDGDRLVVRNVPAGTPAYEQGLNAGDQIVAVDGRRASLDFLNARIDEKRPGETISLNVFRHDELRSFNVKLGERTTGSYRILTVSQPTEAQQRIYQGWLGAPLTRIAGTEDDKAASPNSD